MEILIFSVLAAAPLGIGLGVRVVRRRREARRLRAHLQSYIPADDGVPRPGPCVVQGRIAEGSELQRAPISDRSVVVWRLAVFGYRFDKFGRRHKRCLIDPTE